MSNNNTKNTAKPSKNSSTLISEGDQMSTTILSTQQLDDLIKNSYHRFHHEISHSTSDLNAPPESRDLERLNRCLTKIRSSTSLQNAVDILSTTSFTSIKNRCKDFYTNIFLRQSERDGYTNDFVKKNNNLSFYSKSGDSGNSSNNANVNMNVLHLILLSFPDFFPYFDEEDQIELLDALSSLLLQVTPEKSGGSNKSLDFQLFEIVVKTITNVLQKCLLIKFNRECFESFSVSILTNSLTIAENISELYYSKSFSTTSNYIVHFLPIIALLCKEINLSENQEIHRLVQQYMVASVIFTVNNPKIFNSWTESLDKIAKYLPALLQRKPKIDFSSTKLRIQELLTLIKPKNFKKTEDIIPTFTKLLPGVSTKSLMSLDLADAVYLLSIYFIETIRAERGVVGPILEYIEVEYTAPFTSVLDSMFEPILSTFYIYLQAIPDMERKTSCAAFTMKELITRFSSPNLRVQTRIDPILNQFVNYYPSVVCDLDVLEAITNILVKNSFNSSSDKNNSNNNNNTNFSYNADDDNSCIYKNLSQQRQNLFSLSINKLFLKAIEIAPNLFFSAIFHSQVRMLSLNDRNNNNNRIQGNGINSIYTAVIPFIENFPFEIRNIFMKEFIFKCINTGKAQFAGSFEKIRSIENTEERILLTASFINLYNSELNSTQVELLFGDLTLNQQIESFTPQKMHTYMLAWSHVAMHSLSLSKILIRSLLFSFRNTILNRQGIFSSNTTNLNTESNVVIDEINYQTVLLHFFIESLTIGTHYADYHSIILEGFDVKLLNSSAVLPAIIAYAYLGCLMLNSPYELTSHMRNEMNNFILKLILIAYSYTYDEYVLRYITTKELYYLESLAFILPNTIILPSKAKTNIFSDENGNVSFNTDSSGGKNKSKDLSHQRKGSLSESLSFSAIVPLSKGKVSASVISSVSQSNINYLNSNSADDSLMATFVNLVSYLICDQLQLFNAFLRPTNSYYNNINNNNNNNLNMNNNPNSGTINSSGSLSSMALNNSSNTNSTISSSNSLGNANLLLLNNDSTNSNFSSEYGYNNDFAYHSGALQRLFTLRQMKPSSMHLNRTVRIIWRLAPEALYPFCLQTQKNVGQTVLTVVSQLMENDQFTAPSVPLLSLLYATTPKFNPNPLSIWRTVPGNKALSLLNATIMKDRISATYVAKCFNLFSKRESLLFLPQLIQSLRFDKCGVLRQFLIDYSKQSEVFSHYLLWNILAEKNNPIGENDNLPKILKELEKSVIKGMNRKEKKNYENEFGLIDKLDEVSQKLLPMDIDKRPPALGDMLNEMKLPEGLYIPSNPNYKIISIDAEHSVPLKSHARVPILVHFMVYDEDEESKIRNDDPQDEEDSVSSSSSSSTTSSDSSKSNSDSSSSGNENKSKTKSKSKNKDKKENENQQKTKDKLRNGNTTHKAIPFSCIFKIMDDVRQDAMMIQFIDMTRQILIDANIDAFLFPYRVFTTGPNRGVIECIQRAKSRHDLGVATNEFLLEYFINKYGQVGTPEFQRAQDNFIKSVAPYSLICYLFQVKDRHNANIMLDEDGHIIHIDFGFIFEISPGGNMKFERSPFKLTREMIELMGGSKDSPTFQKFVKLLTQCFFAVRARHQELEAITALMMNAGFPCFLSDSIKKLQQRFFLDKSAKETCNEIVKLIDGAYEANSTTMYDAFQKAQNDIFF